MKNLRATFSYSNYKFYKVVFMIGFIYLLPNLIIVIQVFGGVGNIYSLPLMCAATVITSLFLIKGLREENHHLLHPWLANIGVLILFHLILFMLQIGELSRQETKTSFCLQLGFFICLELQILFWYIIYSLLMNGYQTQIDQLKSISQAVDTQKRDYYKVNLMANEHLMGGQKVICV